MKIALVYDRVNKFGGAERVLQAFHELYPDAPLFTAVYDAKRTPWTKGWDVRTSFIQKIPFAKKYHELFFWLMPYAFESFDFSAFDVVITVTSAEAKGIITKPHQVHINYLLTPTRYLWSHVHEYVGAGWRKALLMPILSNLRQWDFVAAQRANKTVSISQVVAERTKKYYRLESSVLYPPVDTKRFSSQVLSETPVHYKPYYLIVSRLVPYKRVDLVFEAFATMPDKELLVIGEGSELSRLKAIASPNVHFLGFVSDEQLPRYYAQAQALIFPQEEDFGITALEAQAAGTPVIAYAKGAAKETVIDGVTGVFFREQVSEAVQKAIKEFERETWYSKKISVKAQQFDTDRFKQLFTQTVEEAWQTHLNQ
jgi:glycosyltransferase involved in cell wall biosynthesis